MIVLGLITSYVCRLQDKHVKEKQIQHLKAILELQEKLKANQYKASSMYILFEYVCLESECFHLLVDSFLIFPNDVSGILLTV